MSTDARVGVRGEQKRRWDRENRDPCPTPGCHNVRSRRCGLCLGCRRREERARVEARYERIQALWNQGLNRAQIAPIIGTTPKTISATISRMRQEGYNLRRGRAHAAA